MNVKKNSEFVFVSAVVKQQLSLLLGIDMKTISSVILSQISNSMIHCILDCTSMYFYY